MILGYIVRAQASVGAEKSPTWIHEREDCAVRGTRKKGFLSLDLSACEEMDSIVFLSVAAAVVVVAVR